MRSACVLVLVLAAATVFVQCSDAFDDSGFQRFRRSVLEGNDTGGNMTDPIEPTGNMTAPTPDDSSDDNTLLNYTWEMYLVLGLVFLIVLAFGAVFGFFGYRFFKKLVAVFGAVFGFVFGYFLSMYFFEDVINQDGDWVFWVSLGIGVLLLIVGAIVAFQFYIVSVFLVGAAMGVLIGYALWVIVWSSFLDSPWSDIAGWAGIVLLLIAGGLLAIWIQRVVIMIGTAVIGAFFMTIPVMGAIELTVTGLFNTDVSSWFGYITIPLALVLSIGCFVFQYRTVHMDDFDNEFREKDKLLYGN